MSEYPNSGAAWRNQNKTKDSQPHFKGSAEVDGKHYWVSIWLNLSTEGNRPPIKFSFEEKAIVGSDIPAGDEMQALKQLAGDNGAEPPKDYVPGEDFDDTIPF